MGGNGRGRWPALRRVVAVLAGTLAGAALAAPQAAAADVVMAAGDVACPSPGISTPGKCSQTYTSNLALAQQASPEGLTALLALGDLQYPSGGLADFQAYFDPSWGRLRSVLRPVPGNHEYQTSGAAGYWDYFASIGVPVGTRGEGWYSFDVGSTHFVALNSSNGCSPVSCAAGSAQETWLRDDLAATTKPCIVAYWHHPLSNVTKERDIWQVFYEQGVDFVLVGHVHRYRRPIAQDPNGVANPNGPREAYVGTGGDDDNGSGLLKLTLHANSIDWVFVGSGASDAGSATCRGSAPPPAPLPPPPPVTPVPNFEATATGLSVAFEDSTTNSPTSWTWSFGDGTSSADQNPLHVYAAAGTYTVRLTARNGGGSASLTRKVTVEATTAGGATVVSQLAAAPPAALQVLAQSAQPAPLRLRLRARRMTFRLLRAGVPLEVSGPAGRRLTVTLTVSPGIARRAGLSRRRLALRTLVGPGVIRLRASRRVVAALQRSRGRLTVTARVSAPGRTSATRTYTLRA